MTPENQSIGAALFWLLTNHPVRTSKWLCGSKSNSASDLVAQVLDFLPVHISFSRLQLATLLLVPIVRLNIYSNAKAVVVDFIASPAAARATLCHIHKGTLINSPFWDESGSLLEDRKKIQEILQPLIETYLVDNETVVANNKLNSPERRKESRKHLQPKPIETETVQQNNIHINSHSDVIHATIETVLGYEVSTLDEPSTISLLNTIAQRRKNAEDLPAQSTRRQDLLSQLKKAEDVLVRRLDTFTTPKVTTPVDPAA